MRRWCLQLQNGQIDMLLALTDIGPGDGGTMLIPASHKSNFAHPLSTGVESLDEMPEATEVFMDAGDVLLFTVCPLHWPHAE